MACSVAKAGPTNGFPMKAQLQIMGTFACVPTCHHLTLPRQLTGPMLNFSPTLTYDNITLLTVLNSSQSLLS